MTHQTATPKAWSNVSPGWSNVSLANVAQPWAANGQIPKPRRGGPKRLPRQNVRRYFGFTPPFRAIRPKIVLLLFLETVDDEEEDEQE